VIKRLKLKSEFSRNVLTLMTGTTIAQAIPIAISPILTRIYTPEDFGVFALYMSVASILGVIATGRYELAVMLPKKNEDAINIVVLSVLMAVFVSFISLLIVAIFNSQITELLNSPDVSAWLYFIPVTVLLTGIYQSFNYWSNRKKQYKRLAISRVVQNGTVGTANLGMGFTGFGSGGLIFGGILGQIVATSILVKMVWREDNKLIKDLHRLKVYALARKYKKLPMLNLPNVLMDGIRLSGINLLVAKFFATTTLGQFSLAWKMVQTPGALIGVSLSQVFFQKVASAKCSDLHKIVNKFIFKASMIALPVFVAMHLYSVELFVFVFGESWMLAGEAAAVMAPWLFLNFLSSPLSAIFIVLNRQEAMLIFSFLYMLTPIVVIISSRELVFLEVLFNVTLTMSIMLAIFIAMAVRYANKEKR